MQHGVDMDLILVKDMLEGFNEHKYFFSYCFYDTYWVYVKYHEGGDGSHFKNKMPIEPNKF
jgi:hypothetical protein